MDIITPQRLFHGTTDILIPAFRERLLNSRYWRPSRDFGEGFYTTISVSQARKWAMKSARMALETANPCVLEIEMLELPSFCEPLIFLSDSLHWAEFILKHRSVTVKGEDPCTRHPSLIIGPMADADTGKIIYDAVQLKKDVLWFYEQIRRSSRGRRLDSLRLGNQVVFCSEDWENSLRLAGYYIYSGGRWIYHENAGASKLV